MPRFLAGETGRKELPWIEIGNRLRGGHRGSELNGSEASVSQRMHRVHRCMECRGPFQLQSQAWDSHAGTAYGATWPDEIIRVSANRAEKQVLRTEAHPTEVGGKKRGMAAGMGQPTGA